METHETIRHDPLCVELTWRDDLLIRLRLRWSAVQDDTRLATRWSVQLDAWLKECLDGRPKDCPHIPLHWGGLSVFSMQVLRVLGQQVPWGQWVSYGDLARKCGRAGAARAVGRIMAANPWPLLVPCHRVLGGAGQLTGFGGGLDIKRYLLQTEGVRFDPSGKAEPTCQKILTDKEDP